MTRTLEELRKMNEMDPQYKEWVARQPMPDMGTDVFTIRTRRAAHLITQRPFLPLQGPLSSVQERDIKIPTRDGAEITLRIYTPDSSLVPEGGSPLFVAYHEGGWCMGDLSDEEMNCRMASKEFGAVSVNVEYRLAPENKYPIPINDCWDALQWVAANATTELKANPSAGFVIGGASAGGNISAVLALIARDEKLNPPLTGHFLCVPAVMPPVSVPDKWKSEYISWDENFYDPVLRIEKGIDPYGPYAHILGVSDLRDPIFNPSANPHGHGDLPRAYFQVAGLDPLRDEGLLYERLLREEGKVETRLDVYPGFGHMFWMNYPQMEKSNQRWRDTIEGFRWLFQK